jgi:hypothetical protein
MRASGSSCRHLAVLGQRFDCELLCFNVSKRVAIYAIVQTPGTSADLSHLSTQVGHADGQPKGLQRRWSILMNDLNRPLHCFGGSVHGLLRREAPQVSFERLGAHWAVVTDLDERAEERFQIDDPGRARKVASIVLCSSMGMPAGASLGRTPRLRGP